MAFDHEFGPQPPLEGQGVCLCAFCRQMIYRSELDGVQVADLHVYYPDGELKAIELAHARCVPIEKQGHWQVDGGCWPVPSLSEDSM